MTKGNTTGWSPYGDQPARKLDCMKKTRKTVKKVSAEEIARMADRRENVSAFFSNKGKMVAPVQRVNVDFTEPMLAELDAISGELNVSRQAVIKTFLRQSLDQHYLARRAK
jgi:hypothetical protein